MHKPRYRRSGKGWFGSASGRYGRFNVCVMAGTLLLLGSVCLLQVRLAEDGKRSSFSVKNNRTAYSLDGMEREKMRLLREEERRDLDLEREYKIMLAEAGEGGVTEWEANFDDELETESRLNESEKEREDEDDGGERFEELDAEMAMEDEDVDEFESFQGDVGEWLNEVDEFSGKKHEADDDSQKEKSVKYSTENSAEGLNFEANRSGNVGTKERGEDRRGPYESNSGVRSQSRKELTTRSTRNKEEEQQTVEAVNSQPGEEGDKHVTQEGTAEGHTLRHTTDELNSVGKEGTISNTPEPKWILSLGEHKKKDGEESVSSDSFTTEQASKIKSSSNIYLRGGKSSGLWEETIIGVRRNELAEGDGKISAYLRDFDMGRGVFSTDDEPVDDDTLRRMENMVDFEDVLMIKKIPNPGLETRSKKASDKRSGKNVKWGRSTHDLFNPANNPLLQDPDTNEASGLTKSDRVLLKAKRHTTLAGDTVLEGENLFENHVKNVMEKALETFSGENTGIVASTEEADRRKEQTEKGTGFETSETRAEISVENLSEEQEATKMFDGSFQTTSVSFVPAIDNQETHRTEASDGDVKLVTSDRRKNSGDDKSHEKNSRTAVKQVHKLQTNGDSRRWGHFPGLHPGLSFTGFMEEFLSDEKCGLRLFMSWTTPPWSFTIRHQRVLESLLYFHPDACVVVFSESIELTFFQSFVDEGYRVAVAMPHLQELLEETPSEVFASIYLKWRDVDLFYLHYTELLRLVVLYKYGGIYLDMDMIILKPLTGLHNTLGSEILPDGRTRPNGAAMFFERFSPFLNACMVEYTATYDEKLEEWNGAALLERVVNGKQHDTHGLRPEVRNTYSLQSPSTFFPLSSTEIFRYFVAPEDDTARVEEDVLYRKILNESYTVHLWNALTSKLIPEPGSLVHRLMERKCMRCMDIL